MRIAPFWLLLSLLLASPIWAQADSSKQQVPDGLIVTATGQSSEFKQHQLMIFMIDPADAVRKKVTDALEALGLRGAAPQPNMPVSLVVPLPGEKCDGQRIGSVPRAKLVEALEATGVVRIITVRSFSNYHPDTREALEKKALGNAMQKARIKAQEIARQGGGQLDKLLGVEYEIEASDETRVLVLTRDKVQEQEPGGNRIKVVVRYSLR